MALTISSVEILASGRFAKVTVADAVAGGTYDFGGNWTQPGDMGWTGPNDPASAKIVFSVTEPGYSATAVLGTIARTVYGVPLQAGRTAGAGYVSVGCMRKPWQSGGDPVPDETVVAGPALEIIVALSDPVYTGATSVTATIGAGWYDDGVDTTGAFSGSVTMSSTKPYPKPIFQWDTLSGACIADRVKTTFTLAGQAVHKHGIACVIFSTDDGAGGTDTDTVSVCTAVERPNSGYYAETYISAAFSASDYTQGNTITGRARVYPLVGNATAVTDTNDNSTVSNLGQMDQKWELICDKNDSLDAVAYVSTTGSDTTGNGTEGNPYQSIGKAVSLNKNIIYLMAGTHTLTVDPGTRVANTHWYVVQPAPGESVSTVIYSQGNTSTDCRYLQFKNVTIRAVGATTNFNGAWEDNLRFTTCDFDLNGQSPTAGLCNDVPMGLFESPTGDLADWTIQQGRHCIDDFVGSATDGDTLWKGVQRVVGCNLDGVRIAQDLTFVGAVQDNVVIHNSRITSLSGSGSGVASADSALAKGWAMWGCDVEAIGTGQAVTWSTNLASENDYFVHNTVAGNRAAFNYQETGTVSIAQNNNIQAFCIFQRYGTKHDDHPTQNINRTGSWENMMSCGHHGNLIYDGTLSGGQSFPPEFAGILTTMDQDPLFVEDKGANYGDGLGEGDYRAKDFNYNRVTWSGPRLAEYDRTGRPRPSGTTIYLGAILPVPNGVGATLVEV